MDWAVISVISIGCALFVLGIGLLCSIHNIPDIKMEDEKESELHADSNDHVHMKFGQFLELYQKNPEKFCIYSEIPYVSLLDYETFAELTQRGMIIPMYKIQFDSMKDLQRYAEWYHETYVSAHKV